MKLSFEEWLYKNENDLSCEAAETGADRELDFDQEQWEELKYEEYLSNDTFDCKML